MLMIYILHYPLRALNYWNSGTLLSLIMTNACYKSAITLRTLNYGNCGTFLFMGSAGFISSTVPCLLSFKSSGFRVLGVPLRVL